MAERIRPSGPGRKDLAAWMGCTELGHLSVGLGDKIDPFKIYQYRNPSSAGTFLTVGSLAQGNNRQKRESP